MLAAENNNVDICVDDEQSRTYLEYPYNMVVVVSNSSIIGNTGKKSDGGPFTRNIWYFKKVHIVDSYILYMCMYTDTPYIFFVRN